MSFSAQQAHSFIEPILGKTTTFILDGRGTNLSFARVITALVARTRNTMTIFDVDAFYSSNSDSIFGSLPAASAQSTTILVPGLESGIENEIPRIFIANSRAVVVDSLNSLHHLLSSEDGSSRSRKLSFIVGGLSYIAHTDKKALILTMYKREGFGRAGSGRSISGLSDVTASVEVRGSVLFVKCERGTAWPSGRVSVRTL